MGGGHCCIFLLSLLLGIQLVSSYPSKYNEDQANLLKRLFSGQESERSYQGIPDEDDDVININSNDEFTDTERDLIARLLGEKKEMDPYEEMNEKNDEPEERGTEFDGMDTPKYAFGEPSLEDLESEYKRLQAELDAQGIRRSDAERMQDEFGDDGSKFERDYMTDNLDANIFDENMVPDMEDEEYLRDMNEDFSNHEYNRNFDEPGLSAPAPEGYERELTEDLDNEEPEELNQYQDLNEGVNAGEEYRRGNEFEGETYNPEYMRGNDIRLTDINEDEMGDLEKEYFERMMNEENNFGNEQQEREQEDLTDVEDDGIDGGKDEPDRDEMSPEDRAVLAQLVDRILEKKERW